MPKTAGSFKPGTVANPVGRPKGVPNKTTRDVREAIAHLLQTNAENMTRWLEEVANGKPAVRDEDGKLVEAPVPPDPAKALDIMHRMAEYHIPKLGRTEVSGTPGGEPVRLVIGS